MKILVLYYSRTGKTKEMAEWIAEHMKTVDGVEAAACSLEEATPERVNECSAVVFGTPTYYANTCWQWKKWFDEESKAYSLAGKLGAVFATADHAQGGADVAVMSLIGHLLVKGMLVYSSGSAYGRPYVHLGAVALRENFEQSKPMFAQFGERIARKAVELFAEKESTGTIM